jgi:hypothetical protein
MRCKGVSDQGLSGQGLSDRYAGDTGSSRSDVNSHAGDSMRLLGSRDGEVR